MSDKKKISLVVLGKGDNLKKALITTFMGGKLPQPAKTHFLNETEIYENQTYEFICPPATSCDDVRKLFDSFHPDMSLLLVEDGTTEEEVQWQIENLCKTTGKSTNDIIVVLPFSYVPTDFHPLKCYTIEQVFSEVRKLAQDRNLIPTNKRPADCSGSYRSTPHTPTWMTGKHSVTKVNLVLLGLAGTGKSASGNTILGKKQFVSRVSSIPVTTECQEGKTVIDGRHVRVIDTPDIFDDEIKSSNREEHVRKCKQLCQSDPCVYLLVMQVSRFTDGDRDILKKLEKAFGSKVLKQTVLLFTCGDDLWRGDISLEEFVGSCQRDLKKIIEKCDRRCEVFENRASDPHQVEDQVQKLMERVDKMLEERQRQ